MLTAEDVQEILHLLDAANLHELHLETARYTLTLRRAADGAWTQRTQVTAEPSVVATAASRVDETAADPVVAADRPSPDGATATADAAGDLWEVRAPLPGTFYRAPRPGVAPFVEVGAQVDVDTVVGIVETMKLMNSVFAGVRGTVTEICLANATRTAQNGVLLRVRPTAPAGE